MRKEKCSTTRVFEGFKPAAEFAGGNQGFAHKPVPLLCIRDWAGVLPQKPGPLISVWGAQS